ncbi:MAG: NADH-quinone oxidoreductase subunit A [Acidimicrobiia bacterium]|nr:NADH-quinone oxidoreductase subunit A [Acidimicrobiia bacterium]
MANLGQYLPILALLVLAGLFAALSLMASALLAPRRPNDKKAAPYECGIIPAKETPERFPVKFFLVAMIFIVFDIEIIFFYPWAMAHRGLGLFGLVAILVFSFLVFESFVYLISNGALNWGPAKVVRRLEAAIDGGRTTTSTVHRVGLEGREPTTREAA